VKLMAGEQTTTVRGALPLSYAGIIPAAGFEPATSRLRGEVTVVFTTGRNISLLHEREHPHTSDELRVAAGESPAAARTLHIKRSGNMRARMVFTSGGFEPPRLSAYEVSVSFTTDPVKLWLGE
jgi:hypothetical protein